VQVGTTSSGFQIRQEFFEARSICSFGFSACDGLFSDRDGFLLPAHIDEQLAFVRRF
jgi:hypothetical protein